MLENKFFQMKHQKSNILITISINTKFCFENKNKILQNKYNFVLSLG